MVIRNRIKELRHVKASELIPNEKNWRRHPVSQSEALKGALADIGYADALIAYEDDGKLILIDGHLRAETTPEMEVPVLITDLNEEEAKKLLMTHDPLGSMAETDQDMLTTLMEDVQFESAAVRDMVESLLEMDGVMQNGAKAEVLLDQAIQLKPQREYIVVMCDTAEEFVELQNHLELKMVRRGGYKKRTSKSPDEVGIERVITAERLLNACRNTQ